MKDISQFSIYIHILCIIYSFLLGGMFSMLNINKIALSKLFIFQCVSDLYVWNFNCVGKQTWERIGLLFNVHSIKE